MVLNVHNAEKGVRRWYVNLVLHVHRNRTGLLRTGRRRGRGCGGGERGRLHTYRYTVSSGGGERLREIIYLSLHYHHQNDSCVKRLTGSDESHFNVSLIVRDKVKRRRPQTSSDRVLTKRKESRSGIEPRPSSAGQTGSLVRAAVSGCEPASLLVWQQNNVHTIQSVTEAQEVARPRPDFAEWTGFASAHRQHN